MSINVTVTGNPVRINRGKMVTGYDPTKNEFDKRRLMRLEQVRQQSKDIAENIRNKLKKDKSNCMSQIEKEGEARLKNWQARKLLELQNQYQEALDDIGLGHKQATQEEESEEILLQQRESSEQIARERGRAAMERLQIQKNEQSIKKALPIQRKKITRDEENVRARRKINKHTQQLFDSDGENRVPMLSALESDSSDLDAPHTYSKTTSESVSKTSKAQQTSDVNLQVALSDKAAQTSARSDVVSTDISQLPMDMRISERIKRRVQLQPHVDYCQLTEKEPLEKTTLSHCCVCPLQHEQERISKVDGTRPNFQNSNLFPKEDNGLGGVAGDGINRRPEIEFLMKPNEPRKIDSAAEVKSSVFAAKDDKKSTAKMKSKVQNIPPKPKVTLTSSTASTGNQDLGQQPAQYYDHPNRFTKQYLPRKHVQKIDNESLLVSPNVISEQEIHQKMHQRDLEAQVRGQVALEKERLQREYRELLKKLPALQKQERICEIGLDKEKYHMSEVRREEREKKRQNRFDNVYEELFVRREPAIVTLPRRASDNPTLTWDVDFEPTARSNSNNSRSEQLNRMLSSLRAQKDSLLREIENTLTREENTASGNTRTSHEVKSRSSKEEVKSKSTDYPMKKKKKRKRSTDARPSSPESSKPSITSKSTVASTSSPSPRKKAKIKQPSRTRVLILQNTSTQTTPKTDRSAATSPAAEPCTCPKVKSADETDLCEILIKIKDDEGPEVVVNPAADRRSVKVVQDNKITPEKETMAPKVKEIKKPISGKPPWREQLTSSQSSSSTTYLEPPDSAKSGEKRNVIWKETPPDASRSVDSTMSSKQLDPRLLTYIKKLLNMSRISIDELAVSVSDVSTPGSSVVDAPTNNPLQQLANVIKYFNIDMADLHKQLSYVSDGSSHHHNTMESVVTSSDEGGTNIQEDSNKRLHQFAQIAASCTKKISSLTAMIEKVREEKKKMLLSPVSSNDDKDVSTTSYLQLPPRPICRQPIETAEARETSASSSTTSPNEVDGQLLTIDYSYAERLKKLSPEELQTEKKHAEEQDKELLGRLRKLLQSTTVETAQPPLLLDIPKLPRLEAPSAYNNKKRPPTSKSLRAIASNVPVLAHELSTILEADSQLSTKADSPAKKASVPSSQSSSVPDLLTEVPQDSKSSDEEMDTMETMLTSIGMEWAIPTLKKTRETLAMSSSSSGSKKDSGDVSLREFLSKIASSSSNGSAFSDAHGMSLIEMDNRRTSTPVVLQKEARDTPPVFITDSDISSVREQSSGSKDKFYDLNEPSFSKTG